MECVQYSTVYVRIVQYIDSRESDGWMDRYIGESNNKVVNEWNKGERTTDFVLYCSVLYIVLQLIHIFIYEFIIQQLVGQCNIIWSAKIYSDI